SSVIPRLPALFVSSFLVPLPPPPTSPLFPYTTLFRSQASQATGYASLNGPVAVALSLVFWLGLIVGALALTSRESRPAKTRKPRSEEHTSELQSRFDLVCRLLLEKKKQ